MQNLKKLNINKVMETLYNAGNCKMPVFTVFADTAIVSWTCRSYERIWVYTACITGKGIRCSNHNVNADFNLRKRQLEKLQKEAIDIEDANENISFTDLNMNEYLKELSECIQIVGGINV